LEEENDNLNILIKIEEDKILQANID
jgi:hypothetical protein